jgi:acyl CoA:acetate/3-ketoacid CoA transferase
LQEGKSRKFVEEVEHVTFSGRMARQRGQAVTYVTERCVMELRADGLVVREIAPGVDLQRDVLAQASFALKSRSATDKSWMPRCSVMPR